MARADFASVSGGSGNEAGFEYASVSGGQFNTASGEGSSVSGGHALTENSDYAFAAGCTYSFTSPGPGTFHAP